MASIPPRVATCYSCVNSMLHVPPFGDLLSNGTAMENKEIRRRNLLRLAGEFGTLKALAEATKTDPAHLSQIKNQTRDMGDDVARRFEKRLKKPLGWMDLPHAGTQENPDNTTPGPDIRGTVPLISWTKAGKWGEIQDPFHPGDAEEWIPTTAAVSKSAFALRVRGDSMEPRIPDGAIVIIDPAAQYGHGKIVLAKRTNDQEATLKQLWYDGAVPKLRPLNERYAILDMPEDTRIIGVAVRLELDL